MDGLSRGWMNGWSDGWIEKWIDRYKSGWMNGVMNGWKSGWMNGVMNGWKSGWMDGTHLREVMQEAPREEGERVKEVPDEGTSGQLQGGRVRLKHSPPSHRLQKTDHLFVFLFFFILLFFFLSLLLSFFVFLLLFRFAFLPSSLHLPSPSYLLLTSKSHQDLRHNRSGDGPVEFPDTLRDAVASHLSTLVCCAL